MNSKDAQDINLYQQLSQKKKINVLCLPGGGIRGISQIVQLYNIEDELLKKGTSIYEKFDIIIGVSTGAIIGSYIIKNAYTYQKYSDQQICKNQFSKLLDIYKQNCKDIFYSPMGFKSVNYLKYFYNKSLYQKDTIEKLCDKELGDFKFKDSPKFLLIPAWKNDGYDGQVQQNLNVSVFQRGRYMQNMETVEDLAKQVINDIVEIVTKDTAVNSAVNSDVNITNDKKDSSVLCQYPDIEEIWQKKKSIYSSDQQNNVNKHSSKYYLDNDLKLKDAVLASTSAPIYFSPHIITCESHKNKIPDKCSVCFREGQYSDGAVFQNDPSLLIYYLAHKLFKQENCQIQTLDIYTITNETSQFQYDQSRLIISQLIKSLGLVCNANQQFNQLFRKSLQYNDKRFNFIEIKKYFINREIALDSTDATDIQDLIDHGNKQYDLNKEIYRNI